MSRTCTRYVGYVSNFVGRYNFHRVMTTPLPNSPTPLVVIAVQSVKSTATTTSFWSSDSHHWMAVPLVSREPKQSQVRHDTTLMHSNLNPINYNNNIAFLLRASLPVEATVLLLYNTTQYLYFFWVNTQDPSLFIFWIVTRN